MWSLVSTYVSFMEFGISSQQLPNSSVVEDLDTLVDSSSTFSDSEHAAHARSESILRNKECRSDHPQNATNSKPNAWCSKPFVFGGLMSVGYSNDSTGMNEMNQSTTKPDVSVKDSIALLCMISYADLWYTFERLPIL